MRRPFPLARKALKDALEYLERNHYSIPPTGATVSCDGCKKAMAIRHELEELQKLGEQS